jgi:hypothetical protein
MYLSIAEYPEFIVADDQWSTSIFKVKILYVQINMWFYGKIFTLFSF